MADRGFRQRVEQELPRWQQEGWVSAQGGQAILTDLAMRQSKVAWSSSLVMIGAILLGVGAITWLAAHWNEISKVLKLALIAFALIASHVAHGLCLTRAEMPKLAQGLAFLSVLFFGAAIMLIGQIYHIDAHFPDGIAMWAAGGLLTAWLLNSQSALVTSVLLAAIWTWTEQFDYQVIMNWPILVYLALAFALLVQRNWKFAARGWGGLLILWMVGWHAQSGIGVAWESQAHVRLFALQILGLAGAWAAAQASRHPVARALRADFLLAVLVGAFLFTFPDFALHHNTSPVDFTAWFAALVGVIAIYAAGILRLVQVSELPPERLRIGIALAIAVALLLAVETIVSRTSSLQALCWNALFLGILYWISDLGIRHGDRMMVNRAFTGFLIWLLARYVDTFWTLLDRSLFFMAGGLLLLTGGAWLERGRRVLVSTFEQGGRS